jgi:hypothetical protein
MQSHGRLMAALELERQRAQRDLASVMRGRKALAGYGRFLQLGTRLESRG